MKTKTKIAPCPICFCEIRVTECGYATFNVGSASCEACGFQRKISDPNDQEDAIAIWNKAAKGLTDAALRKTLNTELARRQNLRRLHKDKP